MMQTMGSDIAPVQGGASVQLYHKTLKSETYVEKNHFTLGGSMFVMLVVCTNQEWGKW